MKADRNDMKTIPLIRIDGRVGFKVPKQASELVWKLEGVRWEEGGEYFFCEVMRYLPQTKNIKMMKSAGFRVSINGSTLKLIKKRAEEEQEGLYTIEAKTEKERAILFFDPAAYKAYKALEKLCSVKYYVLGRYGAWAERTIRLSRRVPIKGKVAYSVPRWLLRGLTHYYKKRGYDINLPEGVKALNPAFDVTPMKYVSAIVCETGILSSTEFQRLATA